MPAARAERQMSGGATDDDRDGRPLTTSTDHVARVALSARIGEETAYTRILADIRRSRNAAPEGLHSSLGSRSRDNRSLHRSISESLAAVSAGRGNSAGRIGGWEREIGAAAGTTVALFGRLVDAIVLEQILAAMSRHATLDAAGLCVRYPETWPPQPTELTAAYVYLDAMHLSVMSAWRPAFSRTVRKVFVQHAEDVGADNLRYLVETAVETGAEVKFCHAAPGAGLVALGTPRAQPATFDSQLLTLAPDVALPRPSGRWRRTTHASELVITGELAETPPTATGVLARWENNTELTFAGLAPIRREHQGYTIDIRHLENTIAACNAILRVSVVEVPDRTPQIVAVCCAAPGRVDEARAGVTSRLRDLPDYATPGLVFVTDLGRLARWSPAHLRDLVAQDAAHTSVSHEAEHVLDVVRDAWRRALRMPDAPADESNFFAEGGNSLQAASIAAALHRKLGVDIDFALLLSWPVLVEFAAEVARLSAVKDDTPMDPRRANTFESSYEQLQLYLLEARHGDARINNTACAWRFDGTIDRGVLAESIRYVVERHQSLRLRFEEADGRLLCTEVPDASLPALRTRVVTGLSHDPAGAVQDEINRGFDSHRGPLARFALLIEETPETPVSLFVITISHLISDADSLRIIVAELSHAYRQLKNQMTPSLPAARSYHEYAGRQHDTPAEELTRKTGYWSDVFRRYTGPPPWRRQSTAGHYVAMGAPGQYEQVSDLSARSSLSVHSVLLGAYSLMLAAVKDTETVVIGLPTSSRGPQWAGSTVGVFANLVPVVVDTGPASRSDLLRAVDGHTRTAVLNRLPYHEVVTLFRQTTRSTDDPVDNLFSLNHAPVDRIQLGEAVGTFVPAYVDKCEFPLGVGVERADDALRVFFEYDTGIFTTSDVAEMARRYFAGVDSLVEHLERRGAGS
ncbi:condensation domain-containing protein [Amycolatopsis vastitatis]|nr:condensation domain-containing protein [Amycolatopsis vastitatis]